MFTNHLLVSTYYCVGIKYLKPTTIFCMHPVIQRLHYSHYEKKSSWESVIGLEVHAQISTSSKLFSGASTSFGKPANSCVAFFDAAIPGTLPVLNKKCVEAAVTTALCLNCEINPVSTFDRKHYFYADLPAGYQITQQRRPLAKNGFLKFPVFTPGIHKSPYFKSSKIRQIQLEQDSGKSIHDEELQRSLIDLNRAGIPLMELVFEPDLCDGEEAAALTKELSLILRRIKTCSCRMDEGALRVDANVSVRPKGAKNLGTRTEVKNIGSVRAVSKAISYEIARQIKVLEAGGSIIQETRAWVAEDNVTVPMRDKQVVQDYRFMPEPNLPPLRLNMSDQVSANNVNVEEIKRKIPELPEETRQKLASTYKLLTQDYVLRLVNEDSLLSHFQYLMQENPNRNEKIVVNILLNEYISALNKDGKDITFSCNSSLLGEVVDLFQNGLINIATVRNLLAEILSSQRSPKMIVEEKGWLQITDPEKLKELCLRAINENPKAVKQYKGGKEKVFQAFVGYVAKISDNKANLGLCTTILRDLLKK